MLDSSDSYDVSRVRTVYTQAGVSTLRELNELVYRRPNDAMTYYQRAMYFYNLRDYSRALDDFAQASSLQPEHAPIYYQRGLTYYQLKAHRRAIRDFSMVISLTPGDLQASLARGICYLLLEEYEQALVNFDAVISRDPHFAAKMGAYSARGQAYSGTHMYEQALSDFQSALHFKPDDIITLNRFGAAYTDSGQPLKALEVYQTAIRLHPHVAFTYNNRGEAYRLLNRHQEAIQDFDRALVLDPGLALVYYNRGLSFNRLGQPWRALNDFQQALALEPMLQGVYKDRAATYQQLKRYPEALADYDHIIKYDPNALIFFQRGCVYLQMYMPEQAIENFNETIEMCPSFASAYCKRGEAYLHLNDVGQARSDYYRSWRLDSQRTEHGWMAQWIELGLRRIDTGMVERLERIAAVEPENYHAYVCRSAAQWLNNTTQLALTTLMQAISSEPMLWNAYFWKGMAYARLARDIEASEAFEYALTLNMPSALLAPLHLLKQERPDFYQSYALPLLNRQ